jgi:hypothetical protein
MRRKNRSDGLLLYARPFAASLELASAPTVLLARCSRHSCRLILSNLLAAVQQQQRCQYLCRWLCCNIDKHLLRVAYPYTASHSQGSLAMHVYSCNYYTSSMPQTDVMQVSQTADSANALKKLVPQAAGAASPCKLSLHHVEHHEIFNSSLTCRLPL